MRHPLLLGLPAAAAVGSLALPAATPPIRTADGQVVAGSVARLHPIEIDGTRQWLSVRGRDRTAPVLLFVHGGPGTPETAWLTHYDRALEDDFVVVSWEQRGAGRSYPAGRDDPAHMTLERLIADLHAVTQHLKERFGQARIHLVGHSWGTLLAIHAAHRWPEDHHAVVGIAQVSHSVREEVAMHAWVLERARAEGDALAIAQLEALGDPADGPWPLADLSVRLRWVNHYGGGVMHRPGAFRELAWILARSRVYTALDKARYLRAEAFSLDHLGDELAAIDLFTDVPAIDVPIWFVHGRHDHQVPLAVAQAYHDHLDAPAKRFVVFEDAAHSPLFEDPPRFHRVMRAVARAEVTR
jgi:pimeloyl-ACP methyl ester carboxylesterase